MKYMKSCPFCGKMAALEYYIGVPVVHCKGCHLLVSVDDYASHFKSDIETERLISKWNNREKDGRRAQGGGI